MALSYVVCGHLQVPFGTCMNINTLPMKQKDTIFFFYLPLIARLGQPSRRQDGRLVADSAQSALLATRSTTSGLNRETEGVLGRKGNEKKKIKRVRFLLFISPAVRRPPYRVRDGSRSVSRYGQSDHQTENVPVFRYSVLRAVRAARQGGSRTG